MAEDEEVKVPLYTYNGITMYPAPGTTEEEKQEILRNLQKHKDKISRRLAAANLESGVRGLMLGLALGDTLGRAKGKPPASGPLLAGVSTQLACFTAEGTIRALVRGNTKGICHPPSVVSHAYCRWAALQNIQRERMQRRWAESDGQKWPDGWLAQVPELAERRGSAPATVAALSKIEPGSGLRPTSSRGCHALTRTLPLAVIGIDAETPHLAEQAREIAALTHGDPVAQAAAAHATVLVRHCLIGYQVRDALESGLAALPSVDRALTKAELTDLKAAFRQALAQPADRGQLARLAPDATALSALLGGLYVAASIPGRADLRAALHFAAGAPDGDSVACLTGALLGAVHGVEALPVDLVNRHELSWVLDTLARDLLTEVTESPGGGWGVTGWDSHGDSRYPGG